MKTPVVFCIAVLLVALIRRDDCRPLLKPASTKHSPGPQSELHPNLLEVVAPDGPFQLPPTQFQRTLHGKLGDLNGDYDKFQNLVDALLEKGKRRGTPLLSLNVPLHVRNQLIGIAKADKLSKQAEKNRRIMDAIGK